MIVQSYWNICFSFRTVSVDIYQKYHTTFIQISICFRTVSVDIYRVLFYEIRIIYQVFVQYLLIFIMLRMALLGDGSEFSYSICWYLSVKQLHLFSWCIVFVQYLLIFIIMLRIDRPSSDKVFVQYLLIFIFNGISFNIGMIIFVQYLLIFIPLKIKVYKIYYIWK